MSGKVECYSGSTYAERPRAFEWNDERQQVAEILARWRLPDGPGFRVRTAAGDVFELLYRVAQDRWDILPIDNE